MKKITLIATAIVLSAAARAQITIAPEAGLNLANATLKLDNGSGGSVSETGSMKPGPKAGLMVNIPVAGGFYIEPGLLYSMKGTKNSDSYTLLNTRYESSGSFTLHYLEIPLNLGYKYEIGDAGGIFVTAGPYLGYALSGKTKDKTIVTGPNGTITNEHSESIAFGSNGAEMKRLDFGLNFSAGYQLPMGLYFRAQYGLGLANLTNNDNASFKNNVLAFSLGYAIKIGQ